MGKACGRLELPLEAVAADRVERDFLSKQFERHGALELAVPRVVDDRRGAFPEASADLVPREARRPRQSHALLLEESRQVLELEPAALHEELPQKELLAARASFLLVLQTDLELIGIDELPLERDLSQKRGTLVRVARRSGRLLRDPARAALARTVAFPALHGDSEEKCESRPSILSRGHKTPRENSDPPVSGKKPDRRARRRR